MLEFSRDMGFTCSWPTYPPLTHRKGVRAWIASYDCPDYYSFWCGGVFFCVLNSMLFWEDSREEVADREAQVREWCGCFVC